MQLFTLFLAVFFLLSILSYVVIRLLTTNNKESFMLKVKCAVASVIQIVIALGVNELSSVGSLI